MIKALQALHSKQTTYDLPNYYEIPAGGKRVHPELGAGTARLKHPNNQPLDLTNGAVAPKVKTVRR